MTHRAQVQLVAADGSVVDAEASVREYSRVDRLRRATIVGLIAVLLAASLIPIPLIHLLGIPLVLLGGFALAARQLGMVYRLEPVRMACPRCHGVNRVGGGLGMASVGAPTDRMCEVCRRELQLRIILP